MTKVVVKLSPFIPPSEGRLEPIGVTLNTALELPQKRVKWFNIRFPTMEKMINAMYEVTKAEIGAMVYTVPPTWLYIVRAESRTDLWECWSRDKEKYATGDFYFLRVLLLNFASEKQLEYEEKVLRDIAAEMGTISIKEGRPLDRSWIVSTDSLRVYNVVGSGLSTKFAFDSIDVAAKMLRLTSKLRNEHIPPFYDVKGG